MKSGPICAMLKHREPATKCIRTAAEWVADERMIEGDDIAVLRLATYATERNLRLGRCLGSGIHGVVHEAESNAFPGFVAVKAHRNIAPYERERDAYLELRLAQVLPL